MLIRPIIYTPDIYRVVISSFHHIVQIPLQISSRSPTTPETSVLVLIGQLATSLAMGRLRVRSIGGPFQRMTAAPLISCANASLSRAGLVVTPTPSPTPRPPPLRGLWQATVGASQLLLARFGTVPSMVAWPLRLVPLQPPPFISMHACVYEHWQACMHASCLVLQ